MSGAYSRFMAAHSDFQCTVRRYGARDILERKTTGIG